MFPIPINEQIPIIQTFRFTHIIQSKSTSRFFFFLFFEQKAPAAKVRQNFEPKFFDDKLRGIGVVGREYTKEMSRPQSGRRTEELDVIIQSS